MSCFSKGQTKYVGSYMQDYVTLFENLSSKDFYLGDKKEVCFDSATVRFTTFWFI